jgi:type IV pilus assembly protein PilV
MLMNRHDPARGFTLIEVLVTLAIISIGMLGLAKLQAAAQAETAVARVRSLMNFQAESLASAMRSNPTYWQTQAGSSYPQVSITTSSGSYGYSISGTFSQAASGACVGNVTCTPQQLAQDDVNTWAYAFAHAFPNNSSATISCAGTTTTPETCDITLTASEHYLAVSTTTMASAAQTGTSTITLHVQP